MLPIWMRGVFTQEGKGEIDRSHDVPDQVKNEEVSVLLDTLQTIRGRYTES